MTAAAQELAERLAQPSERWNPILVKEVRQALRGRSFRWTFIATLTIAVLGVLTNLADFNHLREDAHGYFMTVHFCLVAALVGMVPFGAFQSMGSEWEESTADLLVLSALRPRRIVAGKLQGALVQAVLFFAAFSPFLVVAYLFPGIDLAAALIYLGVILIASLCASLAALALSTLSKQRFVRVVLMIVLGGQSAWLIPMLMVLGDEVLRHPQQFTSDDEILSVYATIGVALLILAGYVFTLACNMLAHPEENRSTNTRVLTTVSALLVAAYALLFTRWMSLPTEVISVMALAGLAGLSAIGLLLVSEQRALGRRVTLSVPKSPLGALATAPWFPGGGRGVAFHTLHVVLVLAVALSAIAWRRPSAPNFFADGVGALIVAALLSITYVTLLPGLLARLCEGSGARLAVRIATPIAALLGLLVPAAIGAFVGDRDLARLEHLGNPGRLIERAWTQDGLPLRLMACVAGGALVALLVNAPRLVRSTLETLAAARVHRARDERAALGDKAGQSRA